MTKMATRETAPWDAMAGSRAGLLPSFSSLASNRCRQALRGPEMSVSGTDRSAATSRGRPEEVSVVLATWVLRTGEARQLLTESGERLPLTPPSAGRLAASLLRAVKCEEERDWCQAKGATRKYILAADASR